MDDFKKQVNKIDKSSYTNNSRYSLKNLSREVLKKTNWAGVGRDWEGRGGGGGKRETPGRNSIGCDYSEEGAINIRRSRLLNKTQMELYHTTRHSLVTQPVAQPSHNPVPPSLLYEYYEKERYFRICRHGFVDPDPKFSGLFRIRMR